MKHVHWGVLLALGGYAFAQSPACLEGVGGTLFSTGDDIRVEMLAADGDTTDTSLIYLSLLDQGWFDCGSSTNAGFTTTISNLVAGGELQFISYNSNAGVPFRSGPAERNPDGIAHAMVTCEGSGSATIGFEDSYSGGNLDYRDVQFRVSRLPTRPTVLTPETNLTVGIGGTSTLSVRASGSSPLSYQWFKNDLVIIGATNAALALPQLGDADQGSYSVTVSNALGTAHAIVANIAVNHPSIADASATRRLVVSANGVNAVVLLDGSRSSDLDGSILRYLWRTTDNAAAFARNGVTLTTEPLGRHEYQLEVSDGFFLSTNTVSVEVVSIRQALQKLLASVKDARDRRGSLQAKLQAAINAFNRGNLKATGSSLDAFVRQMQIQLKPVNPALAAELTQISGDIATALNSPPTQLRAIASSPFEIELAWADGAPNADGFKVERSADGVHFTQIAQVLPGTASFRNTSLFPQTTYHYRVRSFKASTNGRYSNVQSATTPGSACALSIALWRSNPWVGSVPDAPEELRDVVSLAVGLGHGLGLKSDGTVVGWGYDYSGQTTPPAGLSGVVAVAAGWYHSLALKNDGTVVGWGGNWYGQATPPTNLTGVVAIAAKAGHSLALKNDGTVVAWGNEPAGTIPIPTGLKGVVAIATGQDHNLALKSDGTVVTWGYGVDMLAGLTGVDAVAAGSYQSLALKKDGSVVGWGFGSFGLFGPATTNLHAMAIAASDDTGLALLWDGTVKELGQSLRQPGGLRNVEAVFASGSSAFALTTLPAVPAISELSIPAEHAIQISWTNIDPAAVGFELERATTFDGFNGNWTPLGTTAPGATHFTDTDVTLGSSYFYRVRARNNCGKSLDRYPSGIGFTPPGVPQELACRIGYSNTVTVSWSDYARNANTFVLERAPEVDGSPGNWTEIGIAHGSPNQFSQYFFADTNVTGFSTNWYRVRASNPLGDSAFSEPARIEIIPPARPLDPYVFAFHDQATFRWSPTGTLASGYQVERASDDSGIPGTWHQVGTRTNYYDNEYVDAGLALGGYWYRVRAFNWVGASPASDAVNVTVALPRPPAIVASVGTTNHVDLSIWQDYPQDQDGFEIERASDALGSPGTWLQIAVLAATNYSQSYFTDTNVFANTTNWYRARSFNVLGHSAYSYPASVALAPPRAPEFFSINAYRDTVNMYWVPSYADHLDGFQIDRAPDVGGIPGAWQQIAAITNKFYNEDQYLDSGLAAGTYWYRVRAFNWLGVSTNSAPVAATVTPPAAPWLTAYVGTTNRVELTLFEDYVSEQDGFRIERATEAPGSPLAWEVIGTIPATNRNFAYFTDTNVTANTTNWYRARAFNVVGNSADSEPFRVEVVPPLPPYGIYANAFANRITVYWYGNSVANLDGYQVDRAPDVSGQPGEWSLIATTPAAPDNFFTDAGLGLGTYWYRVRAFNWIGISSNSPAAFANVVPPAAPWLSAAVGVSNQVDVSLAAQGSRDQNGFKLERAPDSDGIPGSWSEIAVVPCTNDYYASYADTNVTANTTNWYRARSYNALGNSAYSEPARVELVPPPAPYYLSASSTRDQVELACYVNYPGHLDGFRIERAPDVAGGPGDWSPANISLIDNRRVDTGLSLGTYWYRVRAFNWVGESSNSPLASATVRLPGAPTVSTYIGGSNQLFVGVSPVPPYDQDGYVIERAADAAGSPGSWTQVATFNASNISYASTYTETNMAANTSIWYRAHAFNILGDSSNSAPVRADVFPPTAPFDLRADVFRRRVTLQWAEVYPGEVGGYLIERAPDAGGVPGAWNWVATNHNYWRYQVDENLPAGSHWYRVSAYNWVGVSEASAPLAVTIGPPQAPSVSLTLGTTNTVNLQVRAGSRHDQDGFEIERANDDDGNPGAWSAIGTNWGDYGSFYDTNAQAFTTNWYRARAFNELGTSDYSPAVLAAIIPPSAPAIISAYPNGFYNFLYWSPGGGLVQSYQIERAGNTNGSPGVWLQIAEVSAYFGAGNQYYSDYLITPSAPYWYRVRARNWVAPSPYSSEVGVNIPPQKTAREVQLANSLKFTSIVLTNGSVQLSWTTTGGTTNFVEAADALDTSFSTISQPILIPGTGVNQTNYEDAGALLHPPQRFYRIRSH